MSGDVAQSVEVRPASGEHDRPRQIPEPPPQPVPDLGQVTLRAAPQDSGEQFGRAPYWMTAGSVNVDRILLREFFRQRHPATALRVLGMDEGGRVRISCVYLTFFECVERHLRV